MDDIVKDFLIESRENLDRWNEELVSLESDPTSKELLAASFERFTPLRKLRLSSFASSKSCAHWGEPSFELRDGALSLNAEITSGLLAMVDAVRRMLNEIQTTEGDGEQRLRPTDGAA